MSEKQTSLYAPRHWPTWIGIGLLRLCSFLPYTWLMKLGRGLGWLVRRLAGKRERIARINLQACFPEKSEQEIEHLISENFAAMGQGLMEVGISWWWPVERTRKHLLKVEGSEHLNHTDQGNILLLAHFSSIELMGRMLTFYTTYHPLYRRNENPVLQALFERYREKNTLGMIPRDDTRSMLRALRKGHNVWFAPDQNFNKKGTVFADFMGVPAASTTATSRFAQMGKAKVVPVILFRVPGGYHLKAEPALENFPSDDIAADTQRINDLFTRWATQAPEQYNWIHRRFKTRPEGEAAFY